VPNNASRLNRRLLAPAPIIMSSLVYKIPTLSELCAKVQEVFHRRPCDFQLRAALTLLQRRDLILIAPTHSFSSRLFNIIIDEAHCVNEWGASFRPEYGKLGELQWMVPPGTPFAAGSATLTPKGIGELQRSLNMRPKHTEVIQLSNDRSNLALHVRRMKHHAKSFFDLAFLIPFGLTVDSPPPKTFMAFGNTRRTSEGMVKYLWSRMAPELQHKLVWLHAGMTEEFKEETIAKLKRGEIWGICCTDAAGMVCLVAVQW
jgi:superfamily II DNA helicase RecQ